MRNLSLAILICISLPGYVYSQNYDSDMDQRSEILFGLKAGTNYANVYDSQGEEFDADPKFGFVGGVFVAIPIGKYFGLQPEVLFSQKGFSGKGQLLGSDYSFTRTTNYLDIPLMFSVKASEFLSIMAGPQYSYLLKQKDEFSSSAASFAQETEFDNDDIRKNTLGFIGGLDFTVQQVVIGARVGWDLQKNHGDGNSSTPRYKNVWYQATIAYRF